MQVRWRLCVEELAGVRTFALRRAHSGVQKHAREVCFDLVKLFGGSSCMDSARMKEFTTRVSTAAFAAAASGVPSELRAICMGKSGV